MVCIRGRSTDGEGRGQLARSRAATWVRLVGRSPIALLSGLLVMLLTGWVISYVSSETGDSGCAARVSVRLAAAPAVAPAVEQVARDASRSRPCVTITVKARPSAAVAAALSNEDGDHALDAWLPESTFWLRRARAAGGFEVPDRGTSVGGTLVVLALPEPVATRLGWPARKLDWAVVLVPGNGSVGASIPDPATDPVGTSALFGVTALAAGGRKPAGVVTATLRRLADHVFTPTAADTDAVPSSAGTAGDPGVYATTEQAVLRHNAGTGVKKLVAVYPPAGVPSLDLPFAVLPGATEGVREAATNFLDLLLSSSGRQSLAAHGFRDAAGTPPADRSADRYLRLEVRQPLGLPPEDAVTQLLTSWSGVQRSARILTVIDVSGSMAATVPGRDETRLSGTIKAAQEGAGLLRDNSELGIWVFSTRIDGERDYRSVLPVAPLGPRRTELRRRLDEVRVKPDGHTGLYDTTLAAYRDARRNWTPGRINLVLIMTDGRNDDTTSISRERLLTELQKLQDPRRPLPLLFIGIGDDIDRSELQGIASVTGGRLFITKEPGGIRQIYFSALADLACLPPECRR